MTTKRTSLPPLLGAYAGAWHVVDVRERSGGKPTLYVLQHKRTGARVERTLGDVLELLQEAARNGLGASRMGSVGLGAYYATEVRSWAPTGRLVTLPNLDEQEETLNPDDEDLRSAA